MRGFHSDNQAVSPVIGAVLIFAMLIIAFSIVQANIIPSQNEKIEAGHYGAVQDDLKQVQADLLTAAESGSSRAGTVQLGPSYPPRLISINAGPPAGQLRTNSVDGNQINSTSVDLNSACRLEDGGQDTIPTQSLLYEPGYNYFEGGDMPHRIEQTLVYQAGTEEGNPVVRADQSLVNTIDRTITLYPVSGKVREGGTRAATLRFVGGYGRSVVVTDPAVVIPTAAPVDTWEEQVGTGNPDVSVSSPRTESINLSFDGQWTVRCRPVGIGNAPDQLPTAEAGEDIRIPEGESTELDGTDTQPESTIASYSWQFVGSPPSGTSLTDTNTATPVIDASGADVDSSTTVNVELEVTDEDGNTDTDTLTATITNTDTSSGTTPSLTAVTEDLRTDSTQTQNFSFSPTEATIPSGTTIAIDLSNLEGGTSSNPDPVKYGGGSVTANFTGSLDQVQDSNNYIIEFTPSSNIGTGRGVNIQLTKVKTQDSEALDIAVPISRSDGDGTTATVDVVNNPSNPGGGNSGQVEISKFEVNNGNIIIQFRNNKGQPVTFEEVRLDSYTEDKVPGGPDAIDRVIYQPGTESQTLDEGGSFGNINSFTLSNGGTSSDIEFAPRRQNPQLKYTGADVGSGDKIEITVKFADDTTEQFSEAAP